MARYSSQYGKSHDPVGSQVNQRTGYSYQQESTRSSQYPSTTAAVYSNFDNTYGGQQRYGSGVQGSSSTNCAAAALSSLSPADSAPSGSTSWPSYPSHNNQPPNRTQNDNSPSYATQTSSSTFDRLNVLEPSQTSLNSYGQFQHTRGGVQSNESYDTTLSHLQSQQQQPQRYLSPLHAVQGPPQQRPFRHSMSRQSPQAITQTLHGDSHNRQQSESVEPSTATVNPSQVYDDRAKRRHMTQIDVEKRRKREEQKALRCAKEDRIAVEKKKYEGQAMEKADEEAATKEKADTERETQVSRTAYAEIGQNKTAATIVTQMKPKGAASVENPSVDNEEAEMRALFQKMRELNAKNPAMLAKIWEEERRNHANSQPPQPTSSNKVPASSAQSAYQKQPTPVGCATSSLERLNGNLSPPSSQPGPTRAKAAPKVAAPNQPVFSQRTTTSWPPQKKGALAEATASWLVKLPENMNKRIKKDDVVKILEINPTYVQLCEGLERLGMRFERTLLARELLKAVPDTSKSTTQLAKPAMPLHFLNGTAAQVNCSAAGGERHSSKSNDATVLNSISSTRAVTYDAPRLTTVADAAQEVNIVGQIHPAPIGLQGGSVQPPLASSYLTLQSQSQAAVNKPNTEQEEPPRLPANKEEAAKKRTFGDLIDLTADDSDDAGPPKKALNRNESNACTEPKLRPSESEQGQQCQPINAQDFYRYQNQPIPGHSATMTPQVVDAHRPGYASPTSSNTVAPRLKVFGPSQEQLQHERIKGKMLVEPIMHDRVARKTRYDTRTIARDVLLATGRHPDMRSLNAHLQPMAKLLGDRGGSYEGMANKSDLSTIRWDIIDPSKLEIDAVSKAEVIAPDAAAEGLAVRDHDEGAQHPPQSMIGRREVHDGDGTISYGNIHKPILSKDQLKNHRSTRQVFNLPEQSTPQPLSIRPDGDGVRQHADIPLVRQGPSGTPQYAPTETQQPVGYAKFRRVDENSNPVKKKGRPVGWRKATHSREAATLQPSQSFPTYSSNKTTQQPEKAIIEPKYRIYACHWRDCKAELHNLGNLKKHVIKMHGRPKKDGMFECQWLLCGAEVAGRQFSGKGKAPEKAAAEWEEIHKWMDHVDKEHLQPVAWELGDGPRGGLASGMSST